MNAQRNVRRRVRLGDDGKIHVRTTKYRDELLTTRWQEIVLEPEDALEFFRSGMIEVLRVCPDAATHRSRGARRGA